MRSGPLPRVLPAGLLLLVAFGLVVSTLPPVHSLPPGRLTFVSSDLVVQSPGIDRDRDVTPPTHDAVGPSGVFAAPESAPSASGSEYSTTLPYGVSEPSAGVTYASFVPGFNFTNSSRSAGCSTPSGNLSSRTALLLSSARPSLVCLNAVQSGVIRSMWQSGLTNATTYRTGDTLARGCAPLPNQTHCAFYGSNVYTANVSLWREGTPTNSSLAWHPGQLGTLPTDLVFYVDLSFNQSTLPGSTYAVTIDLANATPVPVTFFVHTDPVGWNGEANATVVLDLTAAWTTLVPPSNGNGTGVPEIVPTVPGFNLSAHQLPGSRASVTFLESGLPLGTSWSVSLNETTFHGTSNTLGVVLPNGSYSYEASSSNDQFSAPSGLLVTNGTAVAVPVPFSAVFGVSMTPELPLGEAWTLTVSSGAEGILSTSGRGTIDFSVPNGTYSYRDGTVSGRFHGVGGEFTVHGRPVEVAATFTPVNFSIRFQATGLPSSIRWSVSVNGSTVASTTSSLQVEEVNGTYRYSVVSPAGYHVAPQSGVVVVNGAPQNITVDFSGGGGGILGLPGSEGYLVVGGLVAAAAGVAGFFVWRTLVRRRS